MPHLLTHSHTVVWGKGNGMLLDTPVSRDIWIRPFVLESGAGPWGSFRWEGQMPEAKPRELDWPEGLRNFLELCFGSFIQAVSTGCLRIALSWNKTEKKKKRPFGTDLENGSFRVSTLQGLHPRSLESGQIRLTDGPWFTDRHSCGPEPCHTPGVSKLSLWGLAPA